MVTRLVAKLMVKGSNPDDSKIFKAFFLTNDPYEIESNSNASNEPKIKIGILVQPLALMTRPHILIDCEGSIPTLSNMPVNPCRKPRQIHRKILLFSSHPWGIFLVFEKKIQVYILGYRWISWISTCNSGYIPVNQVVIP